MIWRLPHPVRGMIAFVVVWIGGAAVIGFGVGVPEMSILTVLALVAASRGPERRAQSFST